MSVPSGITGREGDPDPERVLEDRLAAPHFWADPYPVYERLRADDPVHWSRTWGCWLLTRYADVSRALREDGRTFTTVGRISAALSTLSAGQRVAVPTVLKHYSGGLLLSDPPAHTRLRSVVNKAFTPRSVELQSAMVETVANELLDAAVRAGDVDLVRDFALPLPATVVARVLGIPIAREDVDRWIANSHEFAGPPVRYAAVMRMEKTLADARSFLLDVAAKRRTQPQDDVMTGLVAALDMGEMTEDELLSTCVTFLIGGYITTSALIASAMHLLLVDWERLDRVKKDESLIPKAIEETLRLESPGQHVTRVAKVPTEIAGRRIEQGDRVLLLLGAANRDPDAFPDAESFDLARSPNRHLAFAAGPHHCVGAPLARLEGALAIRALLRRFPNIRPATDETPEWGVSPGVRLLTRLPVTLS